MFEFFAFMTFTYCLILYMLYKWNKEDDEFDRDYFRDYQIKKRKKKE